jgi:4'-phosphopantetheinyl transferase
MLITSAIPAREYSIMSNLELRWSLPPDQWQLGAADVHVWAANLIEPIERISALEQTLSSDERDRAMRFHAERDRNRFIVGRGVLRTILSSYLEVNPAQLHFVYGPRGKPMLTDLPGSSTLYFNVAHSNELILFALTRAGAVGIDIEWLQLIRDTEVVARRFFLPREVAELAALPRERRALAFSNLLTRKEAFLKATGAGLSAPLAEIEVSFTPGELPRLLSIAGNLQAAACWTLEDLSPAADYKGAVAVAAKGLQFVCWQWPF